MENLLSIILFLPLFSALLLCSVVIGVKIIKPYAIFVSSVEFVLTMFLWYFFDDSSVENGFRFVTQVDIISSFGFSYFIGIDGISLFLVMLSAFMTLVLIIYLNNINHIKHFFIIFRKCNNWHIYLS